MQDKATGNTQQITQLPSAPIKHGRINQRFRLFGGTDLVQLVATVSAKKVTGYFVEAFASTNRDICATGGHVRFTLNR